jgi:opacity protein-like surface antigen
VSDAISLYDISSGKPSRFRIGLGVGSSDGQWGITTRLDNELLLSGGQSATWNRALVWGKLFDALMTLKAGLLDEEAFAFAWQPWGAEQIWGGQFDGKLGAEVQLTPVSGLTVGYIFPIEDGISFIDSIRGSYIAAAYAMPDLFTVVGGVQLSRADYSTDAWLGIDVKGLAGLSARLAAQAKSIGDANISWLEVYEEAGYVVAGIGLNIKAWEEVYAAADSGVGWQVEPTVSYGIGIATLGLSGDLGSLIEQDPAPGNAELPFGYAVAAFVSFALAPSSTIKIGGRYEVGDISASSSTLQTFVSYRWAF